MRKLALCLTIGAALAANTAAANPAATPAANPAADTAASLEIARKALQGFDTEIEKIRTDWKIQGLSVVITKGDQIIYSKGHGMRDAAKNLPMTENTLLPIGSATKAFTTAVMAALVDEGKLDWDQPVRTWIPSFKLQDQVASERMSPLDLVTHRSGMPRHDLLWYNSKISRAEMVRRLQYLEPNKDFRTTFQYNNAMFLTAGYLTEVVTGKSWEDNVRDKLFLPLGMKRTNFSVDQSQKDADFSQPYREEKDGTVKQIPFRSISNVGPAGSINSSAREMAAWMQMHMNKGKYAGKQVLSPSSTSYVHIPRTPMGSSQRKPETVDIGYAPGWFTDVYRGHLRLRHGGNIDGFTALVAMVPESDIGITVLANMNGAAAPDLIVRHGLDRLLGLSARDWSAEGLKRNAEGKAQERAAEAKKKAAHVSTSKPSHPLADYAGEYEHPGYGTLAVQHKDGKLGFTFNDIETPLEHWNYDVFNGLKGKDPAFEDEKIKFNLGTEGEIKSVQIVLEPAVKAIVFTRKADRLLTDPAWLGKLVGRYALTADEKAEVSLRGSQMFLALGKQPPRELIPQRGTRFEVKGLTDFFVSFKLDAKGVVTAMDFEQPNGIFTLKRE
jgi:CubicO group peptidase (beta-lactamase class C family)